MDRDIDKQYIAGGPAPSPLSERLFAALKARRNEFHFTVFRVTNGYVIDPDSQYRDGTYDGKAKYVPDIDGILREVALAIGGEDAVPVMPVSAEEAGLVDEDQQVLDLVVATTVQGSSEGTFAAHSSAVYEPTKTPFLENVGAIAVDAQEALPSINELVAELRGKMASNGHKHTMIDMVIEGVFKRNGFIDNRDYQLSNVPVFTRIVIGNELRETIRRYGTPGTADTSSGQHLGERRNG